MPPRRETADTPSFLKPFIFHGVQLNYHGRTQAEGDCPFCGKDGKFHVNTDNGLWDCKVCGVSGNPLTFLRQLWEASDEATGVEDYKDLAAERGLLSDETLILWGAARSIITTEWLLPGYDAAGKVSTLYRYAPTPSSGGKPILQVTAGFKHGLFGSNMFDPTKPEIKIFEGPWDGMAAWEMMRGYKWSGDPGSSLLPTANEAASLLGSCNVLATPGANVWQDEWNRLAEGKSVAILFDNDHDRELKGRQVIGAGPDGARRVAQALAGSRTRPESIYWLRWGEGPGGCNKSLPSGWDVRDTLGEGVDSEGRAVFFTGLLGKLQPIPADWIPGRSPAAVKSGGADIEPLECTNWKTLINSWRIALDWRQSMDDVWSVAIAVALSTEQQGDQLFLQIIGDAGSAKTRLCDAMLVSKGCYALEHLTGFHSGWKDAEGNDYSLLSRVNRKTLITPEGDVLMSNPAMAQIMSQQRRIFDGSSGASYKNRKEDMRYTGLRTPWIIAGTPALLDMDNARLGDRFLRVFIDPPTAEERRRILRRVGYSALREVTVKSTGDAASCVDGGLLQAYRLTGGYIDYLRRDPEALISRIEVDEEMVVDRIAGLAEFTASMRARPTEGKHDAEATKELPTRLTKQFVRLARCLAVVLNRPSIDDEVMRRVTKVALDTSHGRTLRLTQYLRGLGPKGAEIESISVNTGEASANARALLRYLARPSVGVVRSYKSEEKEGRIRLGQTRWVLSSPVRLLAREVLGEPELLNRNGHSFTL